MEKKQLLFEDLHAGPAKPFNAFPPGAMSRAKIPGGWLVFMSEGGTQALTFVPDPSHEWDGRSLPEPHA